MEISENISNLNYIKNYLLEYMVSESTIKVRIYGDSLGLPRIGHVKNEERYITLLEKFIRQKNQNIEYLDRTRINSTVTYLHRWYVEDNAYFGENNDILIIHCGICDCAPRPIPPKLRGFISTLKGKFREIAVKLVKKNRIRLQKNNFIWRTTEPSIFSETYTNWIIEALKSFKQIYIVNIAPTNESTEKRSPGLIASITQYNAMIAEIITTINKSNIHLIDIYRGINDDIIDQNSDINQYILQEDGHHITPKTHQIIFNKIIETINI